MDKATPVILSMFEAFKTKVKIEMSRKPSFKDLESLETQILNSEKLGALETRITQLETKLKEFEFAPPEDEEEEYDDIDSQYLDDIEVSVEKERRRHHNSNPRIVGSDELMTEFHNTRSKGSLTVRTDSRLQGDELLDSSPRQLQGNSPYKSRATLSSQRQTGMSAASNRQMMVLMRDLASANEKINKLAIDFDVFIKEIELLRSEFQSQQVLFTHMQSQSSTLQHEATQMSKQNEQLQVVLEDAANKTRRMKEEVNVVVDEFRAESGKHLHRLVNLETEIREVKNKAYITKAKTKKKLVEFFDHTSKVNDRADRMIKELRSLKGIVENSDSSAADEIARLRFDLEILKGPVQEYLEVKGKETEILSEEVRRHQGLFRMLAEEYIAILDIKLKAPNDPSAKLIQSVDEIVRLKQENALLRSSTASPVKFPSVGASPSYNHRYSKSTIDWDRMRFANSSMKASPRPTSILETTSSPIRASPRRLKISIKR